MHFLYVTPPPQTQPMILLFAVLMRYLHVSWSRKRDIGDITSSPPLWSDLTDRKIYTHDINVFRNVCSPNEQLAHFFLSKYQQETTPGNEIYSIFLITYIFNPTVKIAQSVSEA